MVLLVFLGWALHCWGERSGANALAAEVWNDLKRYKTDPVINAQDEALDAIVERAEQALVLARTGDTVGVHALARLWQQKWQYAAWRVGWSDRRFREGERITDEALEGWRPPEVLLARGLLASGACRKMADDREPERQRWCEEALEVLDEALAKNGDNRDREWLAVEIQWAAIMTEVDLAGHVDKAGDMTKARRIYHSAMERCEKSWPKLGAAPVNGRELVEDCLAAAGPVQEFRKYLEWSDWLIEKDLRTNNRVTRSTRQHIVLAVDPACNGVRFNSRGIPLTNRSARGDVTDLCRYFGLIALGCPSRATQFRNARQRDVPWLQAEEAARYPVRTGCVLD